jgi:hypothetical protein
MNFDGTSYSTASCVLTRIVKRYNGITEIGDNGK